jgi:hypothetical protein
MLAPPARTPLAVDRYPGSIKEANRGGIVMRVEGLAAPPVGSAGDALLAAARGTGIAPVAGAQYDVGVGFDRERQYTSGVNAGKTVKEYYMEQYKQISGGK